MRTIHVFFLGLIAAAIGFTSVAAAGTPQPTAGGEASAVASPVASFRTGFAPPPIKAGAGSFLGWKVFARPECFHFRFFRCYVVLRDHSSRHLHYCATVPVGRRPFTPSAQKIGPINSGFLSEQTTCNKIGRTSTAISSLQGTASALRIH